MAEELVEEETNLPRLEYTIDNCQQGEAQLALNGACDAILCIPVQYPEVGRPSLDIVTVDGRTGTPMPSIEQFKAFVALAGKLSLSQDLPPHWRALCDAIPAAMHEFISRQRKAGV